MTTPKTSLILTEQDRALLQALAKARGLGNKGMMTTMLKLLIAEAAKREKITLEESK